MQESRFTARCKVLLRDYGYRFEGNTLVENGVKGFTSSRIIGRFPGIYAAIEHLIPIIRMDDFSTRYRSLGS